ncbi:MAG: hypothetical protein DRP30_04080 [Thermotoga sp.]|nr:MAG: hypothetical protein DRP30_04080 [Thermotoga sp.]
MVRVSLYQRKRQKLKITTVIFLFLILLLPVVSFKFSLDLYVRYKFEDLKFEYSDVLSFNKLDLVNIEDSINLVDTKTKFLRLKLQRYMKEIKQIENDIKDKSNFSEFLQLLDDFWVGQSRNEKLFLKELQVGGGTYTVSYFEVTNLPVPISQQAFLQVAKRSNLSVDFSQSEKSPRQYGKYRTFLNVARVSTTKEAGK